MRHGFDDEGRPVPTTEFEYPGESVAPPRADHEAARRWVALLTWLTASGEVVDAGRRAILLSFLLKLDGSPRNVRELGRALKVSHVTAWRMCYKLRREIAQFSRAME